MVLDVYLDAKITEKATGRCISVQDKKQPVEWDEDQWITFHWICGHDAYPLRNDWIDIINRHGKTAYSYNDNDIPFPPSALREMCSCAFSYICLPESNRFEFDVQCGFWNPKLREQEAGLPYRTEQKYDWVDWNLAETETAYRFWADDFYKFIGFIERLYYENQCTQLKASGSDGIRDDGELVFPDDFIFDSDLEQFKANPRAYEWTFRLFNSY